MVALVILPGMDGTGVLLSDFLGALGPRTTARVASYPPDSSLGYPELEEVARTFIPTDVPFVLLAESFSGPIAISIAASQPRGLKGLILCCSFARTPQPLITRAVASLGAVPLKGRISEITAGILLGSSHNVRLRNALKKALARVSFQALNARVKSLSSIDVSHKLCEIQVPILYLRATRDLFVRKASFQHISSTAPQTRLVEIDGPHLLLQAAPSAAARSVRDFLDSI